MTTAPTRRDRRARSARVRVTVIALAVVVAVLLSAAAWVVVRGFTARDELLGALPIAADVRAAVARGDSDIAPQLAELQRRTESARQATSDPVWRAAEVVPVVGQNFTAFREAAAVIDDVADEALPALGRLAAEVSIASLAPRDGRIDLQPLIAARPLLADATAVLTDANARASTIDTDGTVDQVRTSVERLSGLIDEVTQAVTALNTAAELLPPMLGADGERRYLLLFLNNAELRAAGGIPGAVSTVIASDGAIDLAEQSTAGQLGYFDPPPVAATEEEASIFAIPVDRYLQNVTATPDFQRSAQMAQAMWFERTGERVDGVVRVDVGALRLILGATGPVAVTPDDTLTADNAIPLLLSDVYARFVDPSDQDAFFALAAERVFDAVVDLRVDPAAFVDALGTAVDENRIAAWSADPREQQRLVELGLAGALPESTADAAAIGLYLNDATGSKMSYYLDYSVSVAQAICRNDQRPTTAVSVRLRSDAPADAATSLPPYVTGGGGFGVPPGTTRTNLHLYLPPGENVFDVVVDGRSEGFALNEHDGRVVVSRTVDLDPGQTVTVTIYSNAALPGDRAIAVHATPGIGEPAITLGQPLDCRAARPPSGPRTDAMRDGQETIL